MSPKEARHGAAGGRIGYGAGQYPEDPLNGGGTQDGGRAGNKTRSGDNDSIRTGYRKTYLTGSSSAVARGTPFRADTRRRTVDLMA